MEDARAKLTWFKTIILPHQPALRRRLSRIASDREELDDLVSEVLTRAFADPRWHTVDHGRAYLFTIARNLVIDHARREKIVSFVKVAELDVLHADRDPERQLCARDELRRLAPLIDALPQQGRRVFLLRRVREMSVGEIAEEMGLSVSTVEKHLGKAIRMLMEAMAEREDRGFARAGRTADDGDRGAGDPASARSAR